MTPNIITQREAKLKKMWSHPVHRDLVPFMKEDFESFHRESMLALLQSEIEACEGRKLGRIKKSHKLSAPQLLFARDGYNNALAETILHLQEQIALIKKQE